MAQGAHFLTDVIGSVLLVWLTAHLLSIAAPCGAKYRTNNNAHLSSSVFDRFPGRGFYAAGPDTV
jgi:membrane-associated phospholipid phosphatase